MADREIRRKPLHYRDFNLRFAHYNPADGTFKVWVEGETPGGAMSPNDAVALTYDPKAFWKDPILGTGGLLGKLDRRSLPKEDLFKLGKLLTDLALPEKAVRPLFEKSLAALKDSEGLRLRLHLDAPELAQLPWEFMHLSRAAGEPQDTDFLALRREISIVRTDTVEAASRPPPNRIPRIVGVLARPEDQDKLNVDLDKAALDTAVKAFNQVAGQELIRVAWVEKAATRAKLLDVLRDGADVFQFSGHATFALDQEGALMLETQDSESDSYPAAQLAQLLANGGVRLVVLNACESGRRNGRMVWSGVAPALTREKIPAVVANQFDILDTNAILLAARIYPRLLSGHAIDEALFEARQAIYQTQGLEERDWGVPVLYLQDETGVLFPSLIRTPADEVRPAPYQGPLQMLPPFAKTILLGRDEELRQARRALRKGGKIYFYGTYGVGKTSLAAELYRRALGDKEYTDGCLWYLVSKLNAEQVLERIAEKFPEQVVARAMTREQKVAALSEVLARRSNLLIGLDDVADRTVAQAVLEAAGNCTVILNGAQPLKLPGRATERRLEPLSRALAVQLFKKLAGPESRPLTNADEILVEKICDRMRYLPLAVNLAAGKFAEGTESLQRLWERLQAEPESLDDPLDGVAAIFNTHYQDLQQTPTAWQLLVRIACMPASEAPEESLRTGQPDFFGAKDKLVNLALIDYVGPGRLALHPLLGKQVLRVEPKAIAAERARAARWLADYAARNRKDFTALEVERANLSGLLDCYADERRWDDLVALLRDLFDYLRVRGQWQEAFERLDAVVAAGGQGTQSWNLAWAYLHRGIMHTLRAEYATAQADFDQADRLFTEVGDQAYRGKTLYHHANVSILQGALNQARGQLEQAIRWMADAAPPTDRAGAHERLANLLVTQGEPEAAQPHFEAALALGDAEKQSRAHIVLGKFARQKGDYRGAEAHLASAGQLINGIDDVLTRASLYRELGYVHYYQGHYADAGSSFERAGAIFADLKYQPGLAQVRQALGNVALACGQLDEATEYYRAALQINEARDQGGNAAYNRYQLGVVAQRQQRYEEAKTMYCAADKAASDMEDIGLQAAVQHQLASLALANEDIAEATESNQKAIRLARQATDALTETSALYYRSLLELKAGNLEAGRQTLAQVHASFVTLNSPEVNKVAALLANLDFATRVAGIITGGLPTLMPAFAGEIDVTVDSWLGAASGINVTVNGIDTNVEGIDVTVAEAELAGADDTPAWPRLQ